MTTKHKTFKACESCGYETTRLVMVHGYKCCPDCASLED